MTELGERIPRLIERQKLIWQEKTPTCGVGAKFNDQQWRGLPATKTIRDRMGVLVLIMGSHSPSGDAFGSRALSISAHILLDTLGASPVVCGEGTPGVSVAASGTVAMAGLFGVEF